MTRGLVAMFGVLRARLAARPDTEHQQAVVRIVVGALLVAGGVLLAGVAALAGHLDLQSPSHVPVAFVRDDGGQPDSSLHKDLRRYDRMPFVVIAGSVAAVALGVACRTSPRRR